MTARPEPRLAPIGNLWTDMADHTATIYADLLRRTAIAMRAADDPDLAARRAVEGVGAARSGQGRFDA